jgi:addiction module RelB/DinJ family antitoxin
MREKKRFLFTTGEVNEIWFSAKTILHFSTISCIIEYKRKELMMLVNKVLADKAITFRVDGVTKEQAERMLDEIGMNMTTYLASSLKALVREKRIPFDMVTQEYLADQVILAKLAEAEREIANPNTVLLDHDEVFGPIRKQFGYEV